MSEITKCENNLKKYFESLDFILSMLHYESEILLTIKKYEIMLLFFFLDPEVTLIYIFHLQSEYF